VCSIVVASNYLWGGTYDPSASGSVSTSITNGILNMYINTAAGASNYLRFSETTYSYYWKFASTSINAGSIVTDPVAKT